MTDIRDQERSTRLAQRLAGNLETNGEYLAHLFSVIRGAEGLDDHGIANALGAPLDLVPRIALCRTPRDDMFKEDVDEIAEHFSLDPHRLAQLVRHGQTLSAFSHAYTGELLAAARDYAAEERGDYAANGEHGSEPSDDEENRQSSEPGSEEAGEER
jgi:hypothetical protein